MIWQPTEENIQRAAAILQQGGIGAIPTETVYGLAADAFNDQAVAKIFEVKNRPTFNPLIIHISDLLQIKYLSDFPIEKIRPVLDTFWPGALTIVLPKKKEVPDLVTAGNQSVAIRMPNHWVAKALLEKSNLFLAAPSANPSNYISPTSADHVESQLGNKLDFILDGGPSTIGLESTVVSFVDDNPVLLRHGGITLETLQTYLPKLTESIHQSNKLSSPGQLKIHYSPKTPLRIWTGETLSGNKTGFLSWNVIPENQPVKVVSLTTTENFVEAAANLFDRLHQLDKMNLEIIYVQPIPEIGLGRAIMDRIKRAAEK